MEEEWVIGVAKDLKPPEHKNPEYLAIFPAGTKEGEFGPMICMVSDLSSVNDGDVAHAKLIAVAPKLLEVLESLTEIMSWMKEHLTESGKQELVKAFEVITKAKGI